MIVILLIVLVLAILVAAMFIVSGAKKKAALARRPAAEALPEEDGKEVADTLAGAIRCRTVSYSDQSKVDWIEFEKLHKFLEERFPIVHSSLEHEVIGKASLVYCWKGSDPSLEPILLTAHQDVVPEEELSRWEHGPFDGDIADGFVWGRGAFDVKIQFVAILSAAEKLLKEGFAPKRTVYFGFGCNEEVSGDGAVLIASEFKRRGIHFHMVLDEGGAVMDRLMKQIHSHVAVVGVAEKGHLNLKLSVKKHGGHSSTPDNPTSLGILGRALARVEVAQMPCHLVKPMKWFFEAVGSNTSGLFSLLFSNLWLTRPLVFSAFRKNPQYAAFIRTTHAATMCSAADAPNVVPDVSEAIVNCRLIESDTPEDVRRWVEKTIRDKRVKVEETGESMLQSPVSPIDCEQFDGLRAIIGSVFKDTIAVPYFMSGGSDARHYSSVSDNIYRFTPAMMNFDELGRMHNYNERLSVDNCGKALEFYLALLARFAG
ncbi:MAG: M20/M25/M40 family metallo-hydrolase [Sphaerochaetaceae bacterium]